MKGWLWPLAHSVIFLPIESTSLRDALFSTVYIMIALHILKRVLRGRKKDLKVHYKQDKEERK